MKTATVRRKTTTKIIIETGIEQWIAVKWHGALLFDFDVIFPMR